MSCENDLKAAKRKIAFWILFLNFHSFILEDIWICKNRFSFLTLIKAGLEDITSYHIVSRSKHGTRLFAVASFELI
jgi:hypothetical protein